MDHSETPHGRRGGPSRPPSADPSAADPSAAPRAAHAQTPAADDARRGGRLIYRNREHWINGRALSLAIWVVHNQDRINDDTADSGQLFVSWKGQAMESISGHIKISID